MKKNKNEIITVIVIVVFSILSYYFYNKSNTVITKDEINYQEKGKVNYKVYLTDKTYYNSEFLDEGMQYISSIIDYIDLKYTYNATYDTTDTYNITKRVLADVKIVDRDNNDKIIYNKKETIKEEHLKSDNVDINENLKIDYKKYNALTNQFKTSYGISANCSLVIDYQIEYQSKDKGIKNSRLFSVQVPLSEQMINISKTSDLYNSGIYIGSTTDSPLNKTMSIISMILLALSIAGVLLLIFQIRNRIKKESKYDRLISKLLRENDSYITIAKEEYIDPTKKIIKVDSFKELFDVRNNLEKPIIYLKINEDESKFIIVDNEIFEYRVTRKEIE